MVPGAISFLQAAGHIGIPVWCLSNDVERWSLKLRENFRIESYLEGAVISSAARARKPSPEIYRLLLARSGYAAEEIIFVDDRQKNVAVARELGISALQFSRDLGYEYLKRQVLIAPPKTRWSAQPGTIKCPVTASARGALSAGVRRFRGRSANTCSDTRRRDGGSRGKRAGVLRQPKTWL